MKINVRYIYTIVQLVILLLSLVSNWYRDLTLLLALVLLIMILDKMGKGIVLRESTAMLYVITSLIMPLVGYMYYTSDNRLSKIWIKYMPIAEDTYFSFALPAIACFCIALTCPLGIKDSADEGKSLEGFINRMKQALSKSKNYGLAIIVVGVITGRLVSYLPGGLQFFATLFFFASFAGLLYVYFLPDYKYKKIVILAFLAVNILNALSSGMFTIVAYMGITIYSFFLIASKPSLLKKTILLILASCFIIVLQNTKLAYRKYTWKLGYAGSQVELFSQLFIDNLQKGDVLIEKDNFFPIYTRINQGYNVAMVMRRIPSYQPHDDGKNLFTGFASTLIPRFLWPDKPEAGGKFNMKYYAGYSVVGWSTDVGPLGEAYGSFGVTGGILYMFLLGAFIRWAYKRVFLLSRKIPLLICWIPVLFFQITYSGETDTLQILNSLFKAAIFIWLLYKLFPFFFGVLKKESQTKTNGVVPMTASTSV